MGETISMGYAIVLQRIIEGICLHGEIAPDLVSSPLHLATMAQKHCAEVATLREDACGLDADYGNLERETRAEIASLRSRLEIAERNGVIARAVVADAEYALACEGGSFGYDAMQRLRQSVSEFNRDMESPASTSTDREVGK